MSLIKAFTDTFSHFCNLCFSPRMAVCSFSSLARVLFTIGYLMRCSGGTWSEAFIEFQLGMAGMFISFVYFYYRSLVNVPCKICRRESQLWATIELQWVPDGVPSDNKGCDDHGKCFAGLVTTHKLQETPDLFLWRPVILGPFWGTTTTSRSA